MVFNPPVPWLPAQHFIAAAKMLERLCCGACKILKHGHSGENFAEPSGAEAFARLKRFGTSWGHSNPCALDFGRSCESEMILVASNNFDE